MKILRIIAAALFTTVLAHEARLSGSQSAEAGRLKTRNIILVTTDGLRWQEVFGGADPSLMDESGGVKDPNALRVAFHRESPAERREALLPFLTGVIAVMGPDTAPRRPEPRGAPTVAAHPLTQGRVASTLAAFLGFDYSGFAPKAAPPIPGVLPANVQARRP